MLTAPGNPNIIFVATGAAGSVWGCPVDGKDNCLLMAEPANGRQRSAVTLTATSTTLYTK